MTLTMWRIKGKKNQSDTASTNASVKTEQIIESAKQTDANTVKTFFSKLFG